MSVSAIIAVFAVIGGLMGLGADRLAVAWLGHLGNGVRRGIDWRTVVLVVVGSTMAVGIVARYPYRWDVFYLCAFSTALLVLLATDLEKKILPDVITIPLIGATAGLLVFNSNPLLFDEQLGLLSGVAAGIGTPAFLFASDRILQGDLGDGDLKLAVSVGLLCGVTSLIGGLLVASVGFAAVLIGLIAVGRIGMRTAIPFGPVLIFAAFVAILIG